MTTKYIAASIVFMMVASAALIAAPNSASARIVSSGSIGNVGLNVSPGRITSFNSFDRFDDSSRFSAPRQSTNVNVLNTLDRLNSTVIPRNQSAVNRLNTLNTLTNQSTLNTLNRLNSQSVLNNQNLQNRLNTLNTQAALNRLNNQSVLNNLNLQNRLDTQNALNRLNTLNRLNDPLLRREVRIEDDRLEIRIKNDLLDDDLFRLRVDRDKVRLNNRLFDDVSLLGGTSRFAVLLSGSNEVPAVSTLASGSGVFTIDTVNNTLAFNLTYRNLSSSETGAHIHGPATAGMNGPILFQLPAGSPKSGVWAYPESLENVILSGQTYVNVHSQLFPGGEIRGQIIP